MALIIALEASPQTRPFAILLGPELNEEANPAEKSETTENTY
jgi:hypothetical protein